MGLIDAIGKGPVGLDTSIFIYWIEDHPRWAPDAIQVAAAAAAGCGVFVTNDRDLEAGDVIRVLQLSDYSAT